MEYSLVRVLGDDEFVDVMDSFDCMCSLMTKLEMIGRNLSMGDYAILSYDYELGEEEVELVIFVDEEGAVHICDE